MSADPFFELQALLHPITDEQPSGPDLLLSLDFDEIQAARRHEDMSLDQGEWVTQRKEANLPFVVQRCSQLLRERTKDLRLAIWLTDALASQYGLRGLTQGYQLMNALVDRYWDSVHPVAEDGDTSARTGNIRWLLQRTVEQLGRAQLLDVGDTGISMLTWESAVALDQAVRRQPSEAGKIVGGKTTIDELERLRAQVPSTQLQALAAQLADFRVALDSFESTLDAKLADEAPSFASVRETLDKILHLARRWGSDDSVAQATSPAAIEQASSPAPLTTSAEPEISMQTNGEAPHPIRTRADAIELLQQAAAFFKRTEPSSPAAYMAQKAAVWAQLPLHEWLKHVVKNDAELAQLEEMLGVASHSRVQRND